MFDIGTALSIGGSLLGAIGGGKGQSPAQSVSGFQSLPSEIQDYMTQSIFPRIQGYAETPYQWLPTRRVNAMDTDPVFGSPARQELQRYYDMQRLSNFAAQQSGNVKPNDAAELADMEARMMARQAIMSGQGLGYGGSRQTARNQEFLQSGMFNDAALADIGKALMATEKAGLPYASQAGQDVLRRDNPELMNNVMKALQSVQLEAAQRKGLI